MTETSTYKHWYEYNPGRLQMEKIAMAQHFPEFEFLMVNNGEIRYSGTLKSDKFIRSEGYCVDVDYGDGGIDNFGNPGIVISPRSPDFNDLFPASFAYSEELQRKLLNRVAIDMKCVGYEDPATEQTPTIITAASLLKKVIDWLVKYESEKGKIEQVDNHYQDAIARKRYELRERLINGEAIIIGKNVQYWWLNDEMRTIRENALKCTFPQFHMKPYEISFPEGYRKELLIEGTIGPGIAIFHYDNRKDDIWTYEIKLWYRTNECSVHLGVNDCGRIYRQLGFYPIPLRNDGFLWHQNTTCPTFVIQKVLRWIIDLEDLITNHLTISQFNAKWKEEVEITIPNGKLW